MVHKWAQTAEGAIAGTQGEPIRITDAIQDQFVHRLRAAYPAILVGGQTWRNDRPRLTTRWATGPHPQRLILTRKPERLIHLGHWPDEAPIHVLSSAPLSASWQAKTPQHVSFWGIGYEVDIWKRLREWLYQELSIASVLVEAGPNFFGQVQTGFAADETIRLLGWNSGG